MAANSVSADEQLPDVVTLIKNVAPVAVDCLTLSAAAPKAFDTLDAATPMSGGSLFVVSTGVAGSSIGDVQVLTNSAPGIFPSNISGTTVLSGCTCDTGVSVSIVAVNNFYGGSLFDENDPSNLVDYRHQL